MKISNNGISLIKGVEGLRLKAYKAVPTEKYYTIGYGHYSKDITPITTITQEKAEELLKDDLIYFENKINSLNIPFTQNQFDALISFTFNVGWGNLTTSTLLKKIKAKSPLPEIKHEFLRWNKSGGTVLNGLKDRRAKEAELYGK